jgi:hypothetical protein
LTVISGSFSRRVETEKDISRKRNFFGKRKRRLFQVVPVHKIRLKESNLFRRRVDNRLRRLRNQRRDNVFAFGFSFRLKLFGQSYARAVLRFDVERDSSLDLTFAEAVAAVEMTDPAIAPPIPPAPGITPVIIGAIWLNILPNPPPPPFLCETCAYKT